MERIRRIAVPVDFSPFSKHAFRSALVVAEPARAQLFLLHVIPEFEAHSAFGIALPSHEEVKARADEWSAGQFDKFLREEDCRGLEVERVVLYGNPARVICDYAQSTQADLIVIATHGRSGLERAVFGSVAEKVLRISTVPLLVIKASKGHVSY